MIGRSWQNIIGISKNQNSHIGPPLIICITTCTCTGAILWAVCWENLQDPKGVGREKKQNTQVSPTIKQKSVQRTKQIDSK